MMALRREKESFHIRAEPLEQFLERWEIEGSHDALLFGENLLRVPEIVSVAIALQDKIEAVD